MKRRSEFKKKPKTVSLGVVLKFRVTADDRLIIDAARIQAGQLLSAYLRAAALSAALEDLDATTRAAALRRLKAKPISIREL